METKILLVTHYYRDANPARAEELDAAFAENAKIVESLGDSASMLVLSYNTLQAPHGRVEVNEVFNRPAVDDYIAEANARANSDTLVVLANSDVVIPATAYLKALGHKFANEVMALTRWEPEGIYEGGEVSQDVWMWKGKIHTLGLKAPLGMVGVDNVMAGLFKRRGYEVSNYACSIRTFHRHASGVRNYNPKERVEGPTFFPIPVALPQPVRDRVLIVVPHCNDLHPDCRAAIDREKVDGIEQVMPMRGSATDMKFRTQYSIGSTINRNRARAESLATDASHFLFVDSDVVIPEGAVAKLRSHDLPIVAGWYPFHSADLWCAGVWTDASHLHRFARPRPGLETVDFAGLGCMLIRREVLEGMTFPHGWDKKAFGEGNQPIVWGPCVAFCHQAAELGFKTHVDGDVICEHRRREHGC